MYDQVRVNEVLALRAQGLGARRISARTGIPVRTVTDWLRGHTPRAVRGPTCEACGGAPHRFAELPAEYAHLLGLYLGDGCISAHPRRVFRLRIVLDAKYPGIIAGCEQSMQIVVPRNRVGRVVQPNNCVEVYAYSRQWPCLFPQHGPGRKHHRTIVLADWQLELVERHPRHLLRGLIQSDGCRFQNTGTNWSHPRYSLKNRSADIRRIFCDACDVLGLRWTTARDTVYVSRKDDVALLDEFVGPKA